ncbi:MAG: Uma2 family endonuclease [Acidithiobacillus sp.]
MVPDWVCKVLSPATVRTDRILKLPSYAAAGVAYCWLIDPDTRTLSLCQPGRPLAAPRRLGRQGPGRHRPLHRRHPGSLRSVGGLNPPCASPPSRSSPFAKPHGKPSVPTPASGSTPYPSRLLLGRGDGHPVRLPSGLRRYIFSIYLGWR